MEVIVVIFVIYTKNAAEWCPRELWGRSVSLFPAYMDYLRNAEWIMECGRIMECKDYGMSIAMPSLGSAQIFLDRKFTHTPW